MTNYWLIFFFFFQNNEILEPVWIVATFASSTCFFLTIALNINTQIMALPNKLQQTLLPSELNHIAENTLIGILPRQSLDPITFIGVSSLWSIIAALIPSAL